MHIDRLDQRDRSLCARADERFAARDDAAIDGDNDEAWRHQIAGWRLCRKAWAARTKRKLRIVKN